MPIAETNPEFWLYPTGSLLFVHGQYEVAEVPANHHQSAQFSG